MPTTRIDRAIEYGKALIDPPTHYGFWRGSWPPPRQPQNPEWMYVETGNPPNPKNQVPNTNCAGLINLMVAAGGSDFRGGTLLYGQRIKNKRNYRPGMHLKRGEVLISAFGGGDEGHIVMVIEDGTDPLTIGSDHSDGGTRPGVNMRYRAQKAHAMFGFEWVGHVEGLEPVPVSDDHEERPVERPERERPERERPRWDRPERDRPERDRPERDRPEREVTLFTAEQLSEISGNPDLETLERYRKALVPEMQKAGITTHLRVAAFLGNVVQETAGLRTLEEYWNDPPGKEAYFRSFLGDQWRYHGRGFIMNTWRDAYARLSDILGEDLLGNPDLLTRPELAAKGATWFWTTNECSSYADRGEFKKVCAIINTGSPNREPKGMTDRLKYYDRAKRILSKDMGDKAPTKNGFNHDGLPLINLAAVGQADETLAFVLAAEIRKAGIGVTVTNGRANVYALAKKIRSESLGYRQLWIIGDPALEACGEYAELANWPASQRTDYYNLAGGDFTATCRRAAELADEKAEEGVGRKFLEAMGDMEPTEPALRPPAQDEEREVEEEYRYKRREEDGQEEEEYRYRRREEWAREDEEDRDYLETPTEEREEVEYRHRRREEEGQEEDGHRDGRDDQPDVPETVEEFTDEELEEIGREFLKLFSRIRENRTPRRESKPHVGKEEH
jgi:predicted chitinase